MAPPPTSTTQDPAASSALPAAEPSIINTTASASAVGARLRTPNYGYLTASAALIGLVGAWYMGGKAPQYDTLKAVRMSRSRTTAAVVLLAGLSLRSFGIRGGREWTEDLAYAVPFAVGSVVFGGRKVVARTAVEFAGFGIAVYATDAAYIYFKDKFPTTEAPARERA